MRDGEGAATLKALVDCLHGQCTKCSNPITLIGLTAEAVGLVGAVEVGRGIAVQCQQCDAIIYLDSRSQAKVLRKGVH
jgi:hypothetical protein